MEVQSTPFLPITESLARSLSSQTIIIQTLTSLSFNTSPTLTLRLMGSVLILDRPGEISVYLPLTFDNKFQVLYQQPKNVRSPKLGIRFYDDSGKELSLFMDPNPAQQWTIFLGKRINQKGFHQMFKSIRKLGKGNFATVYEVERMTDRAKFAVKAFSKEACFSTKNGKESLVNELEVLRKINATPQQNILKLEGVYQSENSIYVILELLTGKTLLEIMQGRRGNLNHNEVRAIMKGLLRGASHMHSNRIMHRDIKPENIMLRGISMDPVIVDFGLATDADVEEYIFFRCGTPGYVPPQIVNLTHSEHIEPACDVFSLGAVFHLLLCGRPLFSGTTYQEVYNNNKEFNMALDGKLLAGVSFAAKELLSKMLALDPLSRISASQALEHSYFFEDAEGEADKISSPVLTEVGVSFKEEKKRKGRLC